ncbi:MAG: hypothetical protein CR974_03175 [Gammaproteobacteria bacterium]|nr:MAG: hypothetical protein CR974_03175 [Gammaproteobacteria bacterium]
MLLYIHGFLSSSQSSKAQQLKQWLDEQGRVDEWCCPDLPANPVQALAILTDIIETAEQPIKLLGSSLGGFYSTYLSERYDLKAVVINPSVNPAETLAEKIGTHKAWHTDNAVEFTQDDVKALQAMRCERISRPDNFFLMVERGDETLDYRQAVTYYQDCNQLIFNHGDHSFSRFSQVLALIDAF